MISKNLLCQYSYHKISQRPMQFTVSEVLVRFINSTYMVMFSSLHFPWICLKTNIMSVVPLPNLHPCWDSGHIDSTRCSKILFRETGARVLWLKHIASYPCALEVHNEGIFTFLWYYFFLPNSWVSFPSCCICHACISQQGWHLDKETFLRKSSLWALISCCWKLLALQ